MNKIRTLLTLSLMLSAIFACHSDRDSKSKEVIAEMAAPPPPMEASVKYAAPRVMDAMKSSSNEEIPIREENSATDKKKIIKDGNISIKAKDLTSSKKNIDGITKSYDAYYLSEEMDNNDQTVSYNIVIRIPAANFEKFISSLEKGNDEITGKGIHARDVTEEFTDIETRLTNKRDYLKKYKELLSQARNVKDILAIEESIRVLQEEIESREGRLKYLNDQVAYSTLNIYLFQPKAFQYKPVQEDNFVERVKRSLGNGWTSIVTFILWIISLWPFLILTILVIILWKQFRKKDK